MRPTRRDSVWVGAGAVVSGLGGFGFAWVLARATGASGTGVVLTLATWFTLLLGVGRFGVDTTLVREGGRIRAGGAGAGARSLIRWTVIPAVALSACIGLVVALTAPWLAPRLIVDSPVPVAPLLVAGGAALPVAVYTVVQLALLRGLGDVRQYVGIEQIGKPAIRTGGALILALMGIATATPYYAAWISPGFLAGALTWWFVSRSLRGGEAYQGDRAEAARVWRYALPRAGAQVVDITNVSLGTIILGAVVGAAAAGQYATAFRVVVAGQLAFQAVRLLLAPSLAALLSLNRMRDVQQLFAAGTSLIILVSWPLFLTCFIFPEAVLSVFGQEFVPAGETLRVLSLSGVILSLVGTQGSVVLMSGRSMQGFVAATAGLATNLVLTLSLVAFLDSTAAAIGWTTGVLVEGLLLARVLRTLGLRPLPSAAIAAAGISAMTLGVGLAAAKVALPSEPILGWGVMAAAIACWAALAWRFGRMRFSELTHGETSAEQAR